VFYRLFFTDHNDCILLADSSVVKFAFVENVVLKFRPRKKCYIQSFF